MSDRTKGLNTLISKDLLEIETFVVKTATANTLALRDRRLSLPIDCQQEGPTRLLLCRQPNSRKMLPDLILTVANGNQEVPRCLAPHTLCKSAPPVAGNWKFAWNIWDEHCNVSTATANLKLIRIAGKASQSRSQSPACLTGQNNYCHQPKSHGRDFTSHAGDGFQCVTPSSGRFPRLTTMSRSACPLSVCSSR